ncbi:LysR family transcriptional regulator [Vibrio parahaemolyticus]|uniref:LysR family transcriptional regulator n=1 Tax=Vibrio parahaemolyticus TaxID=670 RepID=UPI001FAB8955|nr:LysR family transcriptional regulator [Vibrio parahaemolyticus]EJE4166730.1 LysR family transcriptional regulator [Vibrio parahaemolyticus]MCI9706344.1 LysR family transcriptional regulator [Vibrio parahaemolyticus]MDF5483219.1 LysR family transcriptional regulator [Vibrio parahaemolyticus]MDG2839637.1 LysR family transcriptional regulator [Vibrio parahaemolyticus]
MDIDQIRAFCLLAESGSYKLTADKLCITQPALTKKIQKLESNIDIQLFERSRIGTTLTSSGELLLPEALLVMQSYNQLAQSAKMFRNGIKGRLKVGFGVSVYQEVPNLISSFKEEFSHTDVTLSDLKSQIQIEMLKRQELDVGFCRFSANDELMCHPLFHDRLALVVPDSAAVDDNPITYMKSASYLKFRQSSSFGFSEQLMFYLTNNGISLDIKQESDSILTLLSMISANLGFSILPLSTKRLVQSGVRFIPLNGKHNEWDICMIWNKSNTNKVIKQFVEFVVEKAKVPSNRI